MAGVQIATETGALPATTRIGIIGDFNPDFISHTATNAAIAHAAATLGMDVAVDWIPTPMPAEGEVPVLLAPYGGLWASPGSPYQSMEGALAGIRFARERGIPFVGT